MNIHKRGIALSGRFCRLEHPSNTHKHHPRKKTSTSSTNLKPNTTQGRRQVPQVQIGNQTPPTEEDKYLEYESETKHHPRRKTSTQVRIGNQNTKKEDEDSETQETCSEDSKHTNCDSGAHGIQEENSSTFRHQKEDPKARQIAKHHQQLKTTKYNGNQKHIHGS